MTGGNQFFSLDFSGVGPHPRRQRQWSDLPPEALMTDAELKQTMKQISKVAGLELSDERIERDLAAYKGHLAAIDRIRLIDLPLEAEPAPRVILKRQV
jgi:hypothetical protein